MTTSATNSDQASSQSPSAEVPAELSAVGMNFPQWQDALTAAYQSGKLSVLGEIRDGQLLSFSDPSGAGLSVLTAEPYEVFARLDTDQELSAHIEMLSDSVAHIEVVQDSSELQRQNKKAPVIATVAAALEQGPLLVDEPVMEYQRVGIAALSTTPASFTERTPDWNPRIISPTVQNILNGIGAVPSALAEISVAIHGVDVVTNQLTGEDFLQLSALVPFSFTIALPMPQDGILPKIGQVFTGTVQFSSSLKQSTASCGAGGCGSGSCGCGGH